MDDETRADDTTTDQPSANDDARADTEPDLDDETRADDAPPDDGGRRTTDDDRVVPRGRASAAGATDRSVGDLLQQPIVTSWTAYLTLLLVLVGAGFGLFGILADAVDEPIVGPVGPVGLEVTVSLALAAPPYLGILVAVFVGAGLGWRLPRDRSTTYAVAGVASGVATAAFWFVAALFGSVPLEASLELGGLLINAILAAVTAGLVAVGGVWATRTRAPITAGERRHPSRGDA